MENYSGTPVHAHQAWQMFDNWNRRGQLGLKSEIARTTFDRWPHWPLPAVVEGNAVRAEFPNGDYLALAEGLTPESTFTALLPA